MKTATSAYRRFFAFRAAVVRTGLVLFTSLLATNTLAAETSARVVSVGLCWTGYSAVIVNMDNGDKVTLGNLSDELTKARMTIALTAKATGEPVYYNITQTSAVCSIPRGSLEWWVMGSSVY